MSDDLLFSKVNQPMSRERCYTYSRYNDGTAMLTVNSHGVSTTIHLSKEDVEAFGRDFNVG